MRKYYLRASIIVLSLILIWLFFFKPFCLWYKEEIRISDILTLLIAGIAFFALWYQNKNFKKNIEIGKLEEIYILVQKASSFHYQLMELYNNFLILRDKDDKSIENLNQFYQKRDKLILKEDFTQLLNNVFRIELLAKSYTDQVLRDELLYFVHIMIPLIELSHNGASIKQELYWEDGFPDYSRYDKLRKDIEDGLVSKITLNRNVSSNELDERVQRFKKKQYARK